jgi:hypothetical protein
MNIFKHIYNTIFNKNKICIDCNINFSNNNINGINYFDNYTLKNICGTCSLIYNNNLYNLPTLNKYITKYKKDKNITKTIGICWKCKNIFENYYLATIYCMNNIPEQSKCPSIDMCRKCNNRGGLNINLQHINIFNTEWKDNLSLYCIKNKINLTEKHIIKSKLIYYRKIFLHHVFIFDIRDNFNKYDKITNKDITMKIICDCCFSEFINNNIIL